MSPKELQKILAENKKKNSVLEELLSAVGKNDLDEVKSIFEENSFIIRDVVVEVNSELGTNLLGDAVDEEIAKYLMEQGVSFSAAVKKAVMKRNLGLVKSICEINKSIAKHELQQNPGPLEAATIDHKFDGEIVRYLIDQGANPNAVDDECYLLHLQIAKGNLKGAMALVKNGANVDIENKKEDHYNVHAFYGDTSLNFAVRAYRNNKMIKPEKAGQALELIHLLINKGANINAQNIHKRTPLCFAVFFDAPKIVELLIKAGADLNIGKNTAEDILHYAITKGHIDIGKAIIQCILEHDSRWLTRSNKPDLLNGQEELSSYWDEYRAQVTELHDTVGDRIDLTGDGSTRPIMRTLSSFLDHSSRKNLVKASLIPSVSDDRSSQTSEGLCPRKLAVISVAAISCALALYFLAPLILGATVGVGTQLALGAVGAVIGGGIGYLTNVAIDKFCGNEVAEQIV